MIAKIEDGGLGMIDVHEVHNAAKCSWIIGITPDKLVFIGDFTPMGVSPDNLSARGVCVNI